MKILFVGRHNNDLDHMVPIAERLAHNPDNRVHYYIASPGLRWRSDFRLGALLAWQTVSVVDVWDLYGRGSPLRTALAHLGRWLHEKSGACRWLHRLPHAVSSFLFRHHDWSPALHRYLDALQPDVIAFDHTDISLHPGPQKRPPYGNGEIAQWGAAHRRPLVAFPHGLLLYPPEGTGPTSNRLLNRFDRVFVESERRKKLFVETGVEAQRLVVSGSARYDPLWLEVLAERLPARAAPDGPGRPFVITFFATKMVYPYDFDRLLQWLKAVAAVEGVLLIVQPHPRGQKAEVFRDLLTCKNVRIDVSTAAALLINRSDAVATLVSSVVVDALCKNIPLLYPKFLHQVTTWFEEWQTCLTLHTQEETLAAMAALQGGWSPAEAQREGFLRHEVYGGGDPATLARITTTLATLAEGREQA
ncbi:MAG: hypothetical protein H7837_01595 [Magnetococcus sp. MYC-9]